MNSKYDPRKDPYVAPYIVWIGLDETGETVFTTYSADLTRNFWAIGSHGKVWRAGQDLAKFSAKWPRYRIIANPAKAAK